MGKKSESSPGIDHRQMRLELFHGRNGKARLRLRGGNGEIIMTAQKYTRASTARETASAVTDAGRVGFEFHESAKPKLKRRPRARKGL